ncbi:MAG: 4-alpha-glucanotransferase [Oscillospiraceae bacterium]|nr:4-alpha-glucanotransferase [Oscillospiraceae bacterium]
MRKSGILLHISSLPSEYGIGKMGREAYRFADFLAETKTGLWQILPLSPTSYGDSPYQSFSAFAGNPYLIDFELLEKEGLLKKDEYTSIKWEQDKEKIDYEFLYENVYKVLRKAYSRFEITPEYRLFEMINRKWLGDYALFMSLKFHYDGKPWYKWPEELAMCDKDAIKKAKEELKDEIGFHKFIQFCFKKQWTALKTYANEKGIKIIGDIPIYVSLDSTEVWKTPELFELDEDKKPVAVAGCPPDCFALTGQLWGNPLYDWDYHKKTDFSWWISRIQNAAETYDIIRIDHFRGFAGYYCIPYGNETAEVGIWKKGPGAKLFKKAEEELGKLDIIAENLGFLTPDVQEMLDEVGYPGMKVIEFGFSDSKNDYLPHNFTDTNSYSYTGTHDNDTLVGWYKSLDKDSKKFCLDYLNVKLDTQIPEAMLRLVWSGVSDAAVAQFQDFIDADTDCRMNIPSTLSGNWTYRAKKKDFTDKLKAKILKLNTLYNRCSELPEDTEETVAKECKAEESPDSSCDEKIKAAKKPQKKADTDKPEPKPHS